MMACGFKMKEMNGMQDTDHDICVKSVQRKMKQEILPQETVADVCTSVKISEGLHVAWLTALNQH